VKLPAPVDRLVRFLASFGLACLLLINLFLLTFFGTLYQVEGGLFEAQKRYFESWIVVQRDPIPLVMPGGLTCMGLLAINLFLGGLVRVRKSKRTIGIIVVHVGIALLLASGFVKLYHSHDGHLTLYEGEESDEFQSYYLWEVAIWDASQTGPVEEHLIPHELIVDLDGGRSRTFTSLALPFEVELTGFLRNCQVLPKGPMWEADSPVVDGYALKGMPDELEAERNLAGITARLRERGGGTAAKEELLWGVERHPATFEAGGKTWALSLRHARYSMPFSIKLADFRKEDHPGMSMARAFESDVIQTTGGEPREVRIQMNEPLRDGGLVLFQSSWGPSNARPGDRLFSVFSVVRNPSDHWPLYACIVIGVGLLLAFVPRLFSFVRNQAKSRAKLQVQG
jgi:hypothetical protein